MKVENNEFPYVTVVETTVPATPDAGDQRLYIDPSDHKLKRVDSAAAVVIVEAGGLADQGAFTYLDATDGAAPADPAAGSARIYSKSGRIYSRDSAGVEYGPFDVAGGGGGLYLLDQQFPGSSLPAGWTFTGSGTCVVSGSKARVTGAAQSDRLMYAYTPTQDNFVIRAHLKAISGAVGMPSIVALDSSGKGNGAGPYNDGSTYGWTMSGTGYQYSGTNVQIDSSQNLTECWLELMAIDGRILGGGWGTDGIAWTGLNMNSSGKYTITQVGICNILGNSTWDLWDFTITEP